MITGGNISGGLALPTGGIVSSISSPVVFPNRLSTRFGDASNTYINLGDNLGKERTDAFSWSFWMKDEGPVGFRHVIRKIGAADTPGVLIQTWTNNRVMFYLEHDASAPNMLRTYCVHAVGSTWQHYCLSYDGSSDASGINFYIDETHPATLTLSNTLSSTLVNSQTLKLGSTGPSLIGNLKDVVLWNKALSQAEAYELYNNGKPLDIGEHSAFANAQAWWRLGDADGDIYPTTEDQIGSIDGTYTNMDADDIEEDSP